MHAVADRPDPPEPAVSLAINHDWIDSAMAKAGFSPGDYDADRILAELSGLWDYEHLENTARELIKLAHEQAEQSR